MSGCERWKDVVGYEGRYIVSDKGNVISLPRMVNGKNGSKYRITGKMLIKKSDYKGYDRVFLAKDNHDRFVPVHRIVAMAFIPNPLEKPQVNHKDGNKKNNNVENLEWCTNGENQKHAYAHNLNHHADNSGRHKIPVEQIDLVIGEVIATYESIADAGRATGVQKTNIRKVIIGERPYAGNYGWKKGGDAKCRQ